MSARVVLGVSGGIAAYKACSLLRLLRESGHDVRVVPTESALRFVGAPTWEALSGHPVASSLWDDVANVPHVGLARWADVVIVAPATADLLSRAAAGRADDLLAATLLTATCPVVMAPAMHTEMWQHPATQANVALLRQRGVHVVEPAVGRLTGADSGPGRLPDPQVLAAAVEEALQPVARDLEGRTVLVSVGGTREPLDPVRFLGNRSSGRQGFAIAERARRRGARVTVVRAHVEAEAPAGVRLIDVETADDLLKAMRQEQAQADVIVMAAAVADFRAAAVAGTKIKKSEGEPAPQVALEANPDVLRHLVDAAPRGQVIVGFAAETASSEAELLALGRDKIARKGCDLLVINDVSDDRVFGQPVNDVRIIALDDQAGVVAAAGSKAEVADALLDEIVKRLPASTS